MHTLFDDQSLQSEVTSWQPNLNFGYKKIFSEPSDENALNFESAFLRRSSSQNRGKFGGSIEISSQISKGVKGLRILLTLAGPADSRNKGLAYISNGHQIYLFQTSHHIILCPPSLLLFSHSLIHSLSVPNFMTYIITPTQAILVRDIFRIISWRKLQTSV